MRFSGFANGSSRSELGLQIMVIQDRPLVHSHARCCHCAKGCLACKIIPGKEGSQGVGRRSAYIGSVNDSIDDDLTAAEQAAQTEEHPPSRLDLTRFLMSYKFGIDEIMTKVNVLKEEFEYVHDYSPIEHVSSRLKSPRGIINKARRIGAPTTIAGIRGNIFDIAGIRITCSFVSDTYAMRDMLAAQPDVEIVVEKDYIASPKPNGYRSLHLIVRTPVFLSDHVDYVYVEVQIRTVAMDFWASLEHKIYYKFQHDVPSRLLDELKEAAETAHRLDVSMEAMHDEVLALEADSPRDDDGEAREEEIAYIAQLFRTSAAKH